jgi:hypothetical protein
MLEAFRFGGWGMYPTLFFGALMVAASVRYAMKPERRWVPLQVSLGIMTMLAGGLGFVTGMIKSFMAMAEATADKRWLWMLGLGESLNNLALALMLLAVGTLAAIVGAYRLARLSPERGLA